MSHQNSRKRLTRVTELVQSRLTWIGANAAFSDNMPQKTTRGLKMELPLLNFSSRVAERLNTTVEKTVEKCREFYKKMCMTHNKCQASTATQVQDFPDKDQHVKNRQDKMHTDEQSIQKIENIGEEVIEIWVVQDLVHKYLFEELLMQKSPKVKEIESQLAKHEVTA